MVWFRMTGLDILVAYWGDVSLFKKTVQSVLLQESDQWFLTVVDDAFPDSEAGRWLTALNHPRIRYFRNEKNLGVIGTYRELLSRSTRSCCVFLGCDDLLGASYTHTVLGYFDRNPNVSFIQPSVKVIDENDTSVMGLTDWVKTRIVAPTPHSHKLHHGESLAVSLLHGDWLYWPSIAFRTESIKRFDFDDSLKITHDLDLVLKMVFAGHQMMLIPEICFEYRRHSTSISAASLLDGRRFKDERRCFQKAVLGAREKSWSKASRAARMHITSRLNALYILLTSLRLKNYNHIPTLARHVAGLYRPRNQYLSRRSHD